MSSPFPSPTSDPSPAELLSLAARLASEAGALALDGLHRTRTLDTKSSVTDMVTEMDRACEALIVSALRAARPDDGIVGEEGADHEGTSGVRWFIDPIDGTTNYVYRHPLWAVSVGAELHGRRVAGAVALPMLGELFTAGKGLGAFRNGDPIIVSAQTDMGKALVGTGFAYVPEIRARQGRIVAELLPEVRDLRRGGSAAADLCFVACGRLDAYFEDGIQSWDACAGALIAEEAGAVVSVLPLDRGTHCAANPTLHATLSARLLQFR